MKKRAAYTVWPTLVGSLKSSCFQMTHPVSNRIFQRSHGSCKTVLFQDSNICSTEGSKHEVKITFETLGKQTCITAERGELLRSALLKRGISPHNGKSRLINCRGLGTCGTCAVEVISSTAEGKHQSCIDPPERSIKERLRLNFPPHSGSSSNEQSTPLRLACQVTVQGDVTVKKRPGFWGQDTSGLAEEFPAELWFGDFEFVLDDKSPQSK